MIILFVALILIQRHFRWLVFLARQHCAMCVCTFVYLSGDPETKEETDVQPKEESSSVAPPIPERESKPRHKSDSQSEVQKIFDKLKVSRLQSQDPAQVGIVCRDGMCRGSYGKFKFRHK